MSDNTLLELIKQVREYQTEYDKPTDLGNPYHPVLRLASQLVESGDNEQTDLLHGLNEKGLRIRAEGMAAYMGSLDPAVNEAVLRQAILKLVKDGDGQKEWRGVSFQNRLNRIFGAVFTGHPCFSMDPEQSGALARYFAHLADSPNHGPETKARVTETSDIYFTPPDLDSESAQSIAALGNLHEAGSRVERIAIEIAREEFPQSWKDLTYAPYTASTWIPFDWDGRADIKWNQLLEKRIELQLLMLGDYRDRLTNLAELLDETAAEAIGEVVANIEGTVQKMEGHHSFFKSYDQADDPGLEKLAAGARRFTEDTDQRITHPDVLIEPLQAILDQGGQSDEAEIQLVHIISRLRNHGITFAHPHFRTNSKTPLSAIGEPPHNLKIDPDLPQHGYFNRYGTRLNSMISRVQPRSTNIGDVATARAPVAAQMGLIRQIVDHVDQHSPVRFLIAETESALVPLSVLYFAKLYGVEDHVDISPLFEDRGGLDRAQIVIDKLLRNDHYRAYVEKRGSMRIQYGYSDSGRYDGQLSAGAFLELIQGQALKKIEDRDPPLGDDVAIGFFDTHGESIGRGSHPVSVRDRLAYIKPGFVLNRAAQVGRKLLPEESFQGADGYLLHGTPEASFAYLTQAIDHLTTDHSDAALDPFYGECRHEARSFFEHVRHAQDEMRKDPNYAALIATFRSMIPATGSRPAEREAISGGERKLPRAIPHNGTLAQLSFMVNVIYGLSHAIEADEESFHKLMEESEQFRMRIAIVEKAMQIADPYILKSYVELYNPAFWQERARNLADDSEKREHCFAVAGHMRRLGLYDQFAPVVESILPDYEYILRVSSELKQDTDQNVQSSARLSLARKRFNMHALHGLRIANMMSLFEHAMQIPDFADRNDGITRDDVIGQLLRMKPEGLETLERFFRTNDNGLTGLDFGKASGFDAHAADYDRLRHELVEPMHDEVDRIQGVSLAIMNHTPFVG